LVTYKTGGKVPYVLQNSDIVRDNSAFEMDSAWAKVGIEPTPGSEYYLNFHYITANFGAPASLSSISGSPQVFLTGAPFSQLWQWPAYNNWGADLSGQQKLGDIVTLKGKLFYHNHVDVGDFYSNPALTQEIARSTYKDNMIGGSLLSEVNVAATDTLRAAFNYRRDDHQEQATVSLPFQEAVSYTGSLGIENQFDPLKNLSIVTGVAYDWWEVTK
jgi:hypothetical protein